jgi:hypothetical protein
VQEAATQKILPKPVRVFFTEVHPSDLDSIDEGKLVEILV